MIGGFKKSPPVREKQNDVQNTRKKPQKTKAISSYVIEHKTGLSVEFGIVFDDPTNVTNKAIIPAEEKDEFTIICKPTKTLKPNSRFYKDFDVDCTIVYKDALDKISKRDITILEIHKRWLAVYVFTYCHLKMGKRRFRVSQIQSIAPAKSDEIISDINGIRKWIMAHH